MIKNKFSISRKAVIISVVLALVVLSGTVFASGILKGALLDEPKDEIIQPSNAVPSIKQKQVDNGIISYDTKTGEVISAISHPELSPSTVNADVKNAAPDTGATVTQNRNISDSGNNNNALNIPMQNVNNSKIKSTSVSDEPYTGFEQLVLKDADTNKIQQELNAQGIVETSKSSVDLSKNYVVKDYNSEETKVMSDENGNISLYFTVNSDNLFDVYFYDSETNEDVGQYGVLANNENAYTFIGFEKDKIYNVEVRGKTEGDWQIEGNYIIY